MSKEAPLEEKALEEPFPPIPEAYHTFKGYILGLPSPAGDTEDLTLSGHTWAVTEALIPVLQTAATAQ